MKSQFVARTCGLFQVGEFATRFYVGNKFKASHVHSPATFLAQNCSLSLS
jgi:hypothetical protein